MITVGCRLAGAYVPDHPSASRSGSKREAALSHSHMNRHEHGWTRAPCHTQRPCLAGSARHPIQHARVNKTNSMQVAQFRNADWACFCVCHSAELAAALAAAAPASWAAGSSSSSPGGSSRSSSTAAPMPVTSTSSSSSSRKTSTCKKTAPPLTRNKRRSRRRVELIQHLPQTRLGGKGRGKVEGRIVVAHKRKPLPQAQ